MLNTSEIVSLTDYLAVLVQGTTLLLPSDLWNVERRQVWTLWGDPKSAHWKAMAWWSSTRTSRWYWCWRAHESLPLTSISNLTCDLFCCDMGEDFFCTVGIRKSRLVTTKYVRWWKKTLSSSQDLNLGPLKSGQMLLPMSYWSSGIGAEDRWHLSIDTVRFSGWISLRLGELCRITTEVLCAGTSKLGNSSSYFVCAVRTRIYRGRLETFLLPKKSAWLCRLSSAPMP